MDSVFQKPLDDDIQDVAEGMAIVINGDTAPQAISSGQYLFIKNHSTLATGGYHATAAITSGGSVTSSNVAADPNGIVNAAYSALNGKITVETGLSKTIAGNSSDTENWGANDTFCFAIIRSASNTTTATFASSDTNNRVCRIYNTLSSQQTIYYSLVHIK